MSGQKIERYVFFIYSIHIKIFVPADFSSWCLTIRLIQEFYYKYTKR